MVSKRLMRGNEAIAEAAIRAGCRNYFAYPITPQAELLQWMAEHMPEKKNGTFLQAESEIGAINMVYGAASGGNRTMTSSSSPGISLKQEGISYLAGANLPAVIVNIMRGGPGLGNIQPAQGDYIQATKGGGHGDYHLIVLAPSSVPEAARLTYDAFQLADKYRMPVVILTDGMVGQMMEPVELPDPIDPEDLPAKPWAADGARGRATNLINTFTSGPDSAQRLERQNEDRFKRYEEIRAEEVRYEEQGVDDADILVVAHGSVGRIAKSAVSLAAREGFRLGIFRPISLWPFPSERLAQIASDVERVLTVEMSNGQMHEDVRLAVQGITETAFYGRTGGVVPKPREIFEEAKKYV